MSLHTEWVRYGENQQYTGYAARLIRAKKPLPVVLVLQEIWGVDRHIQDVVQRFAAAGYAAFAPDLYARDGERPEALQDVRIEEVKRFLDSIPPTAWGNAEERKVALAKLPEHESNRISDSFGAIFGGLTPSLYTEQLLATTEFLRNSYEVTQRQGIASIGFCLGGALSALLACEDKELQGAIIFYGNAPQEEKLAEIACPVLGFYGQLDARITDEVPGLKVSMNKMGKLFDAHVYDGAHHAFFNDTRASYNVGAARDAFARTLQFFNGILGEQKS